MKKQINVRILTLTAAAVALIATGCSSTGVARNDGQAPEAISTLSFQPRTQPAEIVKWPLEWNVKVIEAYTFRVPDPTVQVTANLPTFNEDLAPGSVFVEAAGAEGTPQAYRIVRYSPGAH